MSSSRLVSQAQEALATFSSTSRYAGQANWIAGVGRDLLNVVHAIDASMGTEEEKKKEISLIIAGSLATALAYHMSKYAGNRSLTRVTTDPTKKYYHAPYYPLNWGQLFQICEMKSILKNYDPKDPRFKTLTVSNPSYRLMILHVGKKIINQELPFDTERMKHLFPEMETCLQNVADLIASNTKRNIDSIALRINRSNDNQTHEETRAPDVEALPDELAPQINVKKDSSQSTSKNLAQSSESSHSSAGAANQRRDLWDEIVDISYQQRRSRKENGPSKVSICDTYDSALDGKAVIYTKLFTETIALFQGKRKIFANTRAAWNGEGILFANTRATLFGNRPLMANVRASLGFLSESKLDTIDPTPTFSTLKKKA